MVRMSLKAWFSTCGEVTVCNSLDWTSIWEYWSTTLLGHQYLFRPWTMEGADQLNITTYVHTYKGVPLSGLKEFVIRPNSMTRRDRGYKLIDNKSRYFLISYLHYEHLSFSFPSSRNLSTYKSRVFPLPSILTLLVIPQVPKREAPGRSHNGRVHNHRRLSN